MVKRDAGRRWLTNVWELALNRWLDENPGGKWYSQEDGGLFVNIGVLQALGDMIEERMERYDKDNAG